MDRKIWMAQAEHFLTYSRNKLKDNGNIVQKAGISVEKLESIGAGYNPKDMLHVSEELFGGEAGREAYISCGITLPAYRDGELAAVHIVRVLSPGVAPVNSLPCGQDVACVLPGDGKFACRFSSPRAALKAWAVSGFALTCAGGGEADLRGEILEPPAKGIDIADWWQNVGQPETCGEQQHDCRHCLRYAVPAGGWMGICSVTHRTALPYDLCVEPEMYEGRQS